MDRSMLVATSCSFLTLMNAEHRKKTCKQHGFTSQYKPFKSFQCFLRIWFRKGCILWSSSSLEQHSLHLPFGDQMLTWHVSRPRPYAQYGFGPPLTEFLLQRFPLDGWSLPSHTVSGISSASGDIESDGWSRCSSVSDRFRPFTTNSGAQSLDSSGCHGAWAGQWAVCRGILAGLTLSWLGNPRTKWMFQWNIIH